MWTYPRILAHRGGGLLAPENTLAAMRCGFSRGFRAVEFDVMLAKDGVPVVMHDPHLGRTVPGSGSVPDYTAQELGAMDAGSWFGSMYACEPVPTYRQIFDYCRTNHIWMNVEIKPAPGFEEATGRTVAELTRRWLQEIDWQQPAGKLLLFSSFSFDAVMAAKNAAPEIPRGFLADAIPRDWEDRLKALDAVALHTNQKHLSQKAVAPIKQAGYGLFCYTVNDVDRGHELLSWGVDAFCTDRIDVIGPGFGKPS
jgi:glycerophosphoryl diester phosphodiesterase